VRHGHASHFDVRSQRFSPDGKLESSA